MNAENCGKEKRSEIRLMHSLIEQYKLHNKIRWIGTLFPKHEAGQVYRLIADKRDIVDLIV